MIEDKSLSDFMPKLNTEGEVVLGSTKENINHNIKKDECYPATLVTTSERDDRVVPSHSFKFTAKLQEYQGCNNPILIRTEMRAGHGAGTPREKRINQIAEIYGYALSVINGV